jgi:hypothetical protein
MSGGKNGANGSAKAPAAGKDGRGTVRADLLGAAPLMKTAF